jgi:hypothetical protein
VFSIQSVVAQLRTGRFDDRLYVAHLAIVMCGIAAFVGDADLALSIGIVVALVLMLWRLTGFEAAVFATIATECRVVDRQIATGSIRRSALLRMLTRTGRGAGAPPSSATLLRHIPPGENVRSFSPVCFFQDSIGSEEGGDHVCNSQCL